MGIRDHEFRGWGFRGWGVVLATASLLPACSVVADRALVDSMKEQAQTAYDEAGSPSLEDLLAPPAIGIVGTVTAVDPGVGVWWDVAADGTETPYVIDIQNSDAQASTAHLVVKVDRLLFGPGPGKGDTVIAGLIVGQATPADVRGLLEGERLFMVLGPAGEGIWDYGPDVRGIALDGTFVARTESDGALAFFAFSEEMVSGLGLDGLSPSEIGDLADR
jgi:hypothetical protein